MPAEDGTLYLLAGHGLAQAGSQAESAQAFLQRAIAVPPQLYLASRLS